MSKYYQLNNRIRANELRVVTNEGENLGVLSTNEALQRARQEGLDLVVIAEKAKPPVAKILDFNKFLYEENKKSSASKAKAKKSELKEFRFGPSIGTGDIEQRIKRAKEFIEGGDRVKITVQLRGREKAFPEVAVEKVEMFEKALSEIAKTENGIKRSPSDVSATFVRK